MTLTLNLTERRALLRDAARHADTADLTAWNQALEGAGEEDRAQLAKSLPPSRLYGDEGPTPRACFALAALARPRLAAETLAPADARRERDAATRLAAVAPAVIAGAAARDARWRTEFIDLLAQQYWWAPEMVWTVCHALVRQGAAVPDSGAYLRCFVQWVTDGGGDGPPDEQGWRMARYLGAHADLLDQEFRALFRVEGMGANYHLVDSAADAWDAAVRELCQAGPAFRRGLLAESLDALLRDFPAKAIAWYLRMHRLADPSPQEVADLQQTYFAVLATAPSTAVGLAQDMLRPAMAQLDAGALIEASPGVLLRPEKKLVKAQLALLAAIRPDGAQRQRISQIVAEALAGMPLDLASQARKLVIEREQAVNDAVVQGATASIAVPPPRRRPWPEAAGDLPPIHGDAQLFALIAAQLEDAGQGADLQRLLVHLASHPDVELPEALQQRAAQVIDSVWDEHNASPRRLLAAALLGRDIAFLGYARFVVASPGEPVPGNAQLQERVLTSHRYDPLTGDWAIDEHWTSVSGYQYLPTHSPTALLAGALGQLRELRQGLASGRAFAAPAVLAARRFAWDRRLAEPGEGTFSRDLAVLGEGPRPFWAVLDAPAGQQPADLEALALDVAPVPAEFTFRAQEARGQDGHEVAAQWAAWLLQSNPDTLAAHGHPMLCAAVAVPNVRGMAALLAALGASRQVPGAPVYSALALAASAKMAEQRAQAAEAIAGLAGSGLLDPAPFAAQIAAHLADGFALAGRLAQTLADAASISAIAGCRALQTLQALLPQLIDAGGKPLNQAGKLVELAARLSADYGMALEIPAALRARAKGASALAVALRTLQAIQPQPTALAEEAALAAQRAHDDTGSPA